MAPAQAGRAVWGISALGFVATFLLALRVLLEGDVAPRFDAHSAFAPWQMLVADFARAGRALLCVGLVAAVGALVLSPLALVAGAGALAAAARLALRCASGSARRVRGGHFLFRAVAVRAGPNVLRFRYAPFGYPALLALSWVTLALVALAPLLAWSRRGPARLGRG